MTNLAVTPVSSSSLFSKVFLQGVLTDGLSGQMNMLRILVHDTPNYSTLLDSMTNRNLPCISRFAAPVAAVARAFREGLVPSRFRWHANTIGLICARWGDIGNSATVEDAITAAADLTALALHADVGLRVARSMLEGASDIDRSKPLLCADNAFFSMHGMAATDVWAEDVVAKLKRYSEMSSPTTEGRLAAIVFRAVKAALATLSVDVSQLARAVAEAVPAQLGWTWSFAPLNDINLFQAKTTEVVPLSRILPGRKPVIEVRRLPPKRRRAERVTRQARLFA